MDESIEFTAWQIVGMLPGGWTLADAGDAGGWQGRSWRIRLVDGADVPREVVIEAEAMERHGPVEALRRELDRVYRRVARRGLLG